MIDDFRMLSLFFFISRWDFRMVSKQSRTWIEEKDYEFDIWLNLRPSRYYGHISCGIYVHYVICSSWQCMFKLEIENDWWLYSELRQHLRSIFLTAKISSTVKGLRLLVTPFRKSCSEQDVRCALNTAPIHHFIGSNVSQSQFATLDIIILLQDTEVQSL